MKKFFASLAHGQTKKARNFTTWAVLVLLAAGAALAAFWLISSTVKNKPQSIDSSKYQVVSLVTGQVYFGKLQNSTGEYLTLTTPFIERVVAAEKQDAVAPAQTTLIKVRDQTYGPEDSIAIRADQVAFWQNLRDDSKVTQAIKAKQDQ